MLLQALVDYTNGQQVRECLGLTPSVLTTQTDQPSVMTSTVQEAVPWCQCAVEPASRVLMTHSKLPRTLTQPYSALFSYLLNCLLTCTTSCAHTHTHTQWIPEIGDFVRDKVGGGPAVLVGNSLGGYASLATAAAYPDLIK